MPPACTSSPRYWHGRTQYDLPRLALLAMLFALGSACNSSSTTLLGPALVKCAATSSTPSPMTAAGGTSSLTVSALPECAWTAVAQANWITGLAPTSGQGNGQIQFTVAPNPTASARQADILLNDVPVRLTQQGSACSFSVTPLAQNVAAGGAIVNLLITTGEGCGWTVTSNATWVTVSGEASGNGPREIELEVAPNTGTARAAAVSIAGLTVVINQGAGAGGPQAAICTYAIDPTSRAAGVQGGADRTSVAAPLGCAWTAASHASWITIAGATSGTGPGSVQFVVSTNTGPARTGTLTVAGQVLTVAQDGAADGPGPQPPPPSPSCTFGVAPATHSAPPGGASGLTVSVTAPQGCAWTAVSSVSWLTVTDGAGGSGNGTVTFSVATNTGIQRSATLTVGGQTVTVSQGGSCTFNLSPATTTLGSSGGTGPTITVQTTASCAWTANSTVPWVSITSGTSGTGDGSVRFSVAPNPGPARTGAIVIGDATFTVNQDTGCSAFGIDPTAQSFGAGGGTGGPIAVTAGAACSWTATANDSWITITSGASGIGSGTVGFVVEANTAAARTGTLTIAGQTFTVSQASGCVFTVAPTSFTRDNSAVTDLTVSVTAGAGCSWTAVSNNSWIELTAGASGTGSGTVVFSVDRNRGNGRTGSLTVAGTTVTVVQD